MEMVVTPAFGFAAPPPPEITATPVAETVPALMLMSVRLVLVGELKKPAVPVPTTPVNTPPPFVIARVACAPVPPARTTLLGAAAALAAAVFAREPNPSTRRNPTELA